MTMPHDPAGSRARRTVVLLGSLAAVVLLAAAALDGPRASAPGASGPGPSSSEVAVLSLPATTPLSDSLSEAARIRLLRDLSVLAHDSMEGRRAGTEGAARARRVLVAAFEEAGLHPFGETFTHPFRFTGGPGGASVLAENVIGFLPGREFPDRVIVVTAHYDHLGIQGGAIYNGADDNASGTAALLALARNFAEAPPRHTLVLAALDAEEMGLRGAREFVAAPPVPLASIALNVNLDMVSRSEAGELYAAGTSHNPTLLPLVEAVAAGAPVTLLTGHDTPDLPPGDDWTFASDHAPFHEAGIPFVYFGVEDHPGYHDPSDTFEAVTPEFFVGAVETILAFLRRVDAGEWADPGPPPAR